MDIERLKKKAEEEKVSINLILKEYLHAVTLDFFFRINMFENVVFQGGTAIRFFYNGIRYSEDLDFVLRKKSISTLNNIDKNIKKISTFFEKNVPIVKKCQLKIQKESEILKRYVIISDIEILNMKDKTRIEIGFVPSYTEQISFLRNEYLPFPPLVVVEKVEEILVDKIVSFGGRNYLKGRDIWDIYFLKEKLNVKTGEKEEKILEKKIKDYGMEKGKFEDKFSKNLILLKEKGKEILLNEIKKYLPLSYYENFKEECLDICENTFKFLSGILK
jgi:predicted nucleotidyltransferase component of viral defense system